MIRKSPYIIVCFVYLLVLGLGLLHLFRKSKLNKEQMVKTAAFIENGKSYDLENINRRSSEDISSYENVENGQVFGDVSAFAILNNK